MFCNNCGANIPDDAKFCPNCGQQFTTPQPAPQPQPQPQYQDPYQGQYQQPQPQYQQPQYQQPQYQPYQQPQPAAEVPNATPILVLGLLSFFFCESGLLGLILGAVALSKHKKYVQAGGPDSGKAKTGKIFGVIGLIFSILCMIGLVVGIIIWIVYIVLLGGAVAASGVDWDDLLNAVSVLPRLF